MISDNDSEKVKTALIKAEEAVKNIKDTSLKSKAFELAFAKFLNNEKEPDKNINLLINNKEMSIKEVLLKTKARFDTERC